MVTDSTHACRGCALSLVISPVRGLLTALEFGSPGCVITPLNFSQWRRQPLWLLRTVPHGPWMLASCCDSVVAQVALLSQDLNTSLPTVGCMRSLHSGSCCMRSSRFKAKAGDDHWPLQSLVGSGAFALKSGHVIVCDTRLHGMVTSHFGRIRCS